MSWSEPAAMRLRMERGRPKPEIRAEPRNHAVLHGPSCLLPPPCDAPTLPQVARKFLLSNLLLNERPLLDFSFYCRFSPFFATTSAPSRAFCGWNLSSLGFPQLSSSST